MVHKRCWNEANNAASGCSKMQLYVRTGGAEGAKSPKKVIGALVLAGQGLGSGPRGCAALRRAYC
jgi:hypothetical protein